MLNSIPARIVIGQFFIALLGAGMWGFFGEQREALAAFSGGAIAAILSLYFALKFFSSRGEQDARVMVSVFFRAEALKFVLAAGLFFISAMLFRDEFIPLITTFGAALTMYWFALMWNNGNGN
ncbi:MAG: ATP synthase subunit I [Gammaproteobacteria bacterium]